MSNIYIPFLAAREDVGQKDVQVVRQVVRVHAELSEGDKCLSEQVLVSQPVGGCQALDLLS